MCIRDSPVTPAIAVVVVTHDSAGYVGDTLGALVPALLGAELALLAVAARGGWLREKLRAQRAVIEALPAMLERRREVQARRKIGAAEFAQRLTADLDSPYLSGIGPLTDLQRAYWAAVTRLLALGRG